MRSATKRFVVTAAVLAVAGLTALACDRDREALGPAHDDPGTGPAFAQQSDEAFGATGNGEIQSPPGGKHRQIFGIDIRDPDLDGVPQGKLVFRDQNPATRVNNKPLTLQSVSWASITAIDACADAGIEATGVLEIKQTGERHRFRVIACDNGEPGRGRDVFSLEVFFADGSTRFSWSGTLVGGNIQARGIPTPPPATTGELSITTVTTGEGQPGSYTLFVTGPSFPEGTIGPIEASGNVTVTVDTGAYTVELREVPNNCELSTAEDPNPRTVPVPAGDTGSTTFSVTCTAAPTTGTLSITTATTGEGQPAGYTVFVTGPTFPAGTSGPVEANGTVTVTVDTGPYTVELRDVPNNCELSTAEPNPRTVNVPADDTGSTTFSVSCTATTPMGIRILDGAPQVMRGRVTVPALLRKEDGTGA